MTIMYEQDKDKSEEKPIPQTTQAAEAAIPQRPLPGAEAERKVYEEGRRVNIVKSATPTGMAPIDMDGVFETPVAKLETGTTTPPSTND
jgi:hypothetical protein